MASSEDEQHAEGTTLTSIVLNKEVFLESLRSADKLRFKRYMASPLRYAGGKSLAVGFITELLPPNIDRVISPFIGGGSVEIAFANELDVQVIAYDVFDVLCTYWQVQLSDSQALADKLREFEPNGDTFSEVKQRLKQYWVEGGVEGYEMGRLELASHYYFNSNTSYGPSFLGWQSDVYLNSVRYEKMIQKVENFSASNLSVECADFEDSMPDHPDDFFYCDPPYYLEEGKTFVGMYPHKNFPVHHKGFKHENLRDYLLDHRGGFILSYNDCPTIREWYSDCNIKTPEWQYSFGQGDTRIGKNRRRLNGGSHIKKSHELLIWKYPDDLEVKDDYIT